jgi:hypothetical protein
MTTAVAGVAGKEITVRCEQAVYPPYDGFHGTPHAMLWRRVSIETPRGNAAFEQTDYGHPGKLNPWQARGIAPALTPMLTELQAIAERVASLL